MPSVRRPVAAGHDARRIGPEGITLTQRGEGSNTRWINNIAMEGEDYCDSLLVTEAFTPAGNWSSFPSHRHDEDDFPRITYLEETYYHRLNPADGWAVQRVYTDDGSLDEVMAVRDGDVVLVPRGHHPCGALHGFELYYLNVMAGAAPELALCRRPGSRASDALGCGNGVCRPGGSGAGRKARNMKSLNAIFHPRLSLGAGFCHGRGNCRSHHLKSRAPDAEAVGRRVARAGEGLP